MIVTGEEYDIPHADIEEAKAITGCAKIFAWALLIALSACIVAAFIYLG